MSADTTDQHCSLSGAVVSIQLCWACGTSTLSAALLLSTHRIMPSGMMMSPSPWNSMSSSMQDKASTDALLHPSAPSMRYNLGNLADLHAAIPFFLL